MLGAVDTVMLSRHSDNSVAAVGVVNQIIMLTFLVFEVINLGTSVLCSQYIGARLHKQVVQVEFPFWSIWWWASLSVCCCSAVQGLFCA